MHGSGDLPAVLKHAARLAFVCALAGGVAGCVTKSQADLQARMAYLAGQREAYMQMQGQRSRGPVVSFLGPVTNHIVKWTPGLSLSQAILKAEYLSAQDPKIIVI